MANPSQTSITAIDAGLQAAFQRECRDKLLDNCDWTQLKDTPLNAASVALWVTYRQQLRGLTTQAGFPSGTVWPTAPA